MIRLFHLLSLSCALLLATWQRFTPDDPELDNNNGVSQPCPLLHRRGCRSEGDSSCTPFRSVFSQPWNVLATHTTSSFSIFCGCENFHRLPCRAMPLLFSTPPCLAACTPSDVRRLGAIWLQLSPLQHFHWGCFPCPPDAVRI